MPGLCQLSCSQCGRKQRSSGRAVQSSCVLLCAPTQLNGLSQALLPPLLPQTLAAAAGLPDSHTSEARLPRAASPLQEASRAQVWVWCVSSAAIEWCCKCKHQELRRLLHYLPLSPAGGLQVQVSAFLSDEPAGCPAQLDVSNPLCRCSRLLCLKLPHCLQGWPAASWRRCALARKAAATSSCCASAVVCRGCRSGAGSVSPLAPTQSRCLRMLGGSAPGLRRGSAAAAPPAPGSRAWRRS